MFQAKPWSLNHGLRRPCGYAVAPFALRAIQRLVGGSQNIAHRAAMVRVRRHAHRSADGSQ